MRKILRFIMFRPTLWITTRFSSKPIPSKIFKALSRLRKHIIKYPGKKGAVLPFDPLTSKFIVFSDQHKGTKNGADDFMVSEPNYLAALEYYYQQNFFLVNLGDNEELWENRWASVKRNNAASFEMEKKFVDRNAFIKIFGNHDLSWSINPLTSLEMEKVYDKKIPVHEGLILQLPMGDDHFSIFMTHGHQGDAKSDGNWFSKFFVANIWGPLQAYLKINPNTPQYNSTKKTLHNRIMYEWSARQKNLVLITGHTHQPVFESLTELERLYRKLVLAQEKKNNELIEKIESRIRKVEPKFSSVSKDYYKMKCSYFNSGCCCFSDGDITGIEIAEGTIRLIKWQKVNEKSERAVLEERPLAALINELSSPRRSL
jgi:UDP-2,3-diacylglucosamine pyrophosphatase LpxH